MSITLTRFEDLAQSGWRGVNRKLERLRSAFGITMVVVVFLVAVMWPMVIITVPAGHVGVRWWRLFGGTDTSVNYLQEGTRFSFPWDGMQLYDARVQTANGDLDMLTADGMMMHVDVAIRFRLNPPMAGLLHKHVGPDYVGTLVRPALATYVRAVFSQYAAEDAYGVQRLAIQDRIKQAVEADLTPRLNDMAGAEPKAPEMPWILVQGVLIRSMQFPATVEAAINRKVEQYQVEQEYHYRLERERLESERKEVEAQGIARFQQIVGAGLSENYLRWKGIDATLALAGSPNSKTVVIGTPRDGMPLILGNLDGGNIALAKPAALPAAPAATDGPGGPGAGKAALPPPP